MKKFLSLILVLVFLTLSLTACGKDDSKIVVGATSVPHAEILEKVKDAMAAKGYTLEIVIYDDYTLLNPALQDESILANYFQHVPYLNSFNAESHTDLVSVAKIHYEPLALYGDATSKTGNTILVPSDGSNCTRALLLLAEQGYVTLKGNPTASSNLSDKDIADAKGNNVILVQADMIPAQYKQGGTLAVINGNYALAAGMNISDAIASESAEGAGAQEYANIIAVKRGNENHPAIVALVEALQSQLVYDYIVSEYDGAVLPVFTPSVTVAPKN